jgi:hypothetical protein
LLPAGAPHTPAGLVFAFGVFRRADVKANCGARILLCGFWRSFFGNSGCGRGFARATPIRLCFSGYENRSGAIRAWAQLTRPTAFIAHAVVVGSTDAMPTAELGDSIGRDIGSLDTRDATPQFGQLKFKIGDTGAALWLNVDVLLNTPSHAGVLFDASGPRQTANCANCAKRAR